MEKQKALESVEIFRGLPREELDSIAQLSETKTYKNGDVIFTERSKGGELYIMTKGTVRIELGIKGKNDFATIHRVGEGDLFGELALVSSGQRSASARCETDCETIAIDREKLLELFKKNTQIGYLVMANLASLLATRLRKTNLQLVACFLWE